ncbi:MAG: DNA polymerase IV [Helicobacteraceae bacterium]|nr:DNA polymerase IV [Helicobacteraceae bacterium]
MILHLDIDCFFVSAHRIGKPELENIPLAVGGRSNLSIFDSKKSVRELSCVEGAFTSSILSSNTSSYKEYFVDKGKVKGIITTSSYEARAYGVKTAMSVAEALRYCPTLKVLPPSYPLYHELSHKLKAILQDEIPQVEQFSIDEFFTDVTGWVEDEDVVEFAYKIKKRVKDELGIPISVGIAKTKWIAKLATNSAKPFGVKYVKENEVDEFTKNIPIEAFPGIGKAYQNRLAKYFIKTLGDIKPKKDLFYSWGKSGTQLYDRICGIDREKIALAQSKKSIGLGRTFDPLANRYELKRRLAILCRHLSFLALKGKHNPLTYSLNIKYKFGECSKANINTNRLFSELQFKKEVIKLFESCDLHKTHEIVQLNITLSNFEENKNITMNMLNLEDDRKNSKLGDSLHKLRDKFGIDIIKSGVEL